jgi:hypothetical protein
MPRKIYDDLFTYEPCDYDVVLDVPQSKVSSEMSDDLTKPYLDSEIKTILFHMLPTKSSGPDGFPDLFYETH